MSVEKKVENLIRYVSLHVPYYAEVMKNINIDEIKKNSELFSLIPTMDKPKVRENFQKLISDEIEKDKLIWEYTSGTSGIPLKVGKTIKERSTLALSLMKWRRDNFGIGIASKYAFFTSFGLDNKVRLEKNCLYFSEIHLDNDSLLLYYNLMKANNVEWMYSTPAVTYVLMNFMQEFGLKRIPTLRYIELSGEQISRKEKDFLADFFGCQVAEQYGTIELWSVAQECKNGKIHLLENDIRMELCGNEPFFTALNLYSMPMIRYHVDDLLELDQTCDCGYSGQTIKILKSRSKEFVYVGRNKALSPIFLNTTMSKVLEETGVKIKQFQFIQEEYDVLICYVAIQDAVLQQDVFRDILYEKLKKLYPFPANYDFKVIFVENLLDKMNRGKLGYFKTKIKKELPEGENGKEN